MLRLSEGKLFVKLRKPAKDGDLGTSVARRAVASAHSGALYSGDFSEYGPHEAATEVDARPSRGQEVPLVADHDQGAPETDVFTTSREAFWPHEDPRARPHELAALLSGCDPWGVDAPAAGPRLGYSTGERDARCGVRADSGRLDQARLVPVFQGAG